MTDATPPPPPQPPATPPTPPPPAAPSSGGGGQGRDYPRAWASTCHSRAQHWCPLANWVLAIPHFLVIYGLGIVAEILASISVFTILFTRRNPFVGFQSMVLRYEWRVRSFLSYMLDEYPPFDFEVVAGDNGVDAASVSVTPPEELNRWLPLVKWLLVLPHVIVPGFHLHRRVCRGTYPSCSSRCCSLGSGPRVCGASSWARCAGRCVCRLTASRSSPTSTRPSRWSRERQRPRFAVDHLTGRPGTGTPSALENDAGCVRALSGGATCSSRAAA